jgi:hypothetical protein
MSEEKGERKKHGGEAEEVKEILGVVSTQIPALIRGVVGAVFSEEAGKDMGRAAGAFYKELRESGMPEDVAVKMTQNYIGVFTSLGDMLKEAVSGERKGIKIGKEGREEVAEEITRKIKEKIAEKTEEE